MRSTGRCTSPCLRKNKGSSSVWGHALGERNGPPLRQSRGLLRPQGCAPALFFGCAKKRVRRARWKRKSASAGRSAPAQTSCRRRGMVDGPLRQSGTETRYPWGNHQPGEVRDTSCAAFRCRSPGSSGKPGDLPVGAVINRPPHRGPDGHRRADRGGSSVIKNNLPALGTAGGWDIRWRNKRGILPAQMLCILRQVRWSGFPRLWQPIDSIVALQSAAPHFRAAKRTIQTNLLLFRYPQERDLGKPSVFPVLSPAAKEDLSIIFGRTCACRKFRSPSRRGRRHQSADW